MYMYMYMYMLIKMHYNEIKLTRSRNVFHTGLQIMFGILLYGRGRKVLKSMLQIPPPPAAALTPVLFSSAPTTLISSHEATTNTNTAVSNAQVFILELISNAIKL